MKKAFSFLLCISLLIGCEKSKVEILKMRLENFRNLLPPELREKFDSKNYPAVVQGIDSLLQEVPEFEEKYERLKQEELIDAFSPEEVVDFFREYFVEEIERLQQKKDSS